MPTATYRLLLALAALFAPALQAQSTLWVTSSASSGTGSLRAAIESLSPSTAALQEIRFAIPTTPGNPASEIILTEPLPVITGANVLINGDAPAGRVVVNGNGRQIFTVEASATTNVLEIRDLTLRAGAVVSSGGCVRVRRAATATTLRRLVLDQCTAYLSMINNPTVRGGAVYTTGALTVEDSTFTGNRIVSTSVNEAGSDAIGGALFAEGTRPVTIARSVFSGNRIYLGNQLPPFCTSGHGGAIGLSLSDTQAVISDTRFTDNRASCRNPTVTYDLDGLGDGGAIVVYGQGGETRLLANYFHGNWGNRGGAVGFMQPSGMLATLTNNTFHENTSNQAGGGVSLVNCCALAMINNTFSDNVARSPGMANQLQAGSNVLALYNNIFNGPNSNRDCIIQTAMTNSGYNIYANDPCWTTVDGTSQVIGAMPWLQAPRVTGGYVPTMSYTNGSPPVDSGDDLHCAPYDARGIPRPLDGDIDGTSRCDIGAVEHGYIDVIFRGRFEAG